MKVKKKYNGLVVPAITPLTESHQLDHQAVEKIFENFNEFGAVPFILGTTGEAPSLPLDLKLDFITLAARLKQPGQKLYAGISSNCVADSIEMARHCEQEGVDAVVAHLPAYFNLTQSEIRNYFELLADTIPLPLIIYNIPATTHISIPLKLIDELSNHPNIVGTKDSERSKERLDESLSLWAGRSDFSHFLGWAAQSAYAMINGSDGLVPSTGNLCPGIYQEMLHAVERDDQELALLLQTRSDLLGNLYQSNRLLGGSLAALKSLMQSAGLCQPYVMPPLERVLQPDAVALERSLHHIITTENLNLPFYQ